MFCAELNREPEETLEDGGNVLLFWHPHQDLVSSVLDKQELLEAPMREHECVTIVQSGACLCALKTSSSVKV